MGAHFNNIHSTRGVPNGYNMGDPLNSTYDVNIQLS